MSEYQCVGIDVSSKTCEIDAESPAGCWKLRIPNTSHGHRKLIKHLQRSRFTNRIGMESTGVYGLELALALYRAGVDLMVINPRAARHFAQALMRRSKTDPIDAGVLREYVQRMEFKPWCPPATEKLQLRSLARRMAALTDMMTQEKNRLHAAVQASEYDCIRNDIEVNIRHFQRRLKTLENQAMALINRHAQLQVDIARLISVKGIGRASAVRIYAELCVLPTDMNARQWVAHAGLDPRHFESGTFVGRTRISKAGNKHLRSALYIPALVAKKHEPNVAAFYERLLDRGKAKMQAIVAVMRKLLHAIHAMLHQRVDFDGEKFYAPSTTKA